MAQITQSSHNETVIQAEDTGPVTIPGGAKLLTAEFLREGDDLMIVNQDGSQVRVEDYFTASQPPDLSTGAAVVSGHTVSLFAQSLGDVGQSGPQQEASLGEPAGAGLSASARETDAASRNEPIAEISDVEGEVFVVRSDGTRVAGHEGTPIYEDDIVTTGDDSSAGLRFVDEMTFSLGSNARMLLDDFTYQPEAGEGGGFLSVLQGAFSFVSGEAAHFGLDSLKIETPTMTIGVRGTKVAVQAAAEGEVSRIALLAEDDGTVGKIMVTTDAGQSLLSEANTMVEVVSRFQPPSAQMRISSDQMYQHFGSPLSSLPRPDYQQDASPARDAGDQQTTLQSGAWDAISFAQASPSPISVDPAGLGLQVLGSEDQAPAAQPVAGLASIDEAPAIRPNTAPETEPEPSKAVIAPVPIATPEEPVPVEAPAEPAASAIAAADEAPVPTAEVTAASAAATDGTNETAVPVAPPPPTINQAPVLDAAGAPTLTAIAEDTAAPTGSSVAQIVTDGSITDPDGAVEAIAVTGIDDTNGTWQYSIDGGTTFNAIGAVSDASALLLGSSAIVRFVPNADFNGNASFSYRAWDQSSGSNGQSGVDVSVNGGATAFSAAVETAAISISPLNDAPVLDTAGSPTLTAIAEDSAAPAGNSVAQIVIDGSINDPDGAAVEAIAITDVADSNGAWQFSIDGGATFNAIGAVSDASALLLDSSAIVRFVPNADFNGNATFSYRAWDQSSGSNGQSGVDVSANGGATAFSAAVETAKIAVTPINDAPVLDTAGAPNLTAIANDTVNPTGNTIGQIVIDGSITDPDGGSVEAVAVTGVDNSNGTWEFSTDGGTTFNAVGAVADTSALLLDQNALVRFVPNASFIGNATFTYRAWDQSSGTSGQTGVDVSVNGGTTAFSTAAETAAIAVTASNNAPVLDISGAPTLTAIAEDTAAPTGNTVAQIVIDGSITDLEGAVEAIAVTGVDDANGTWQFSIDGGTSFNTIGPVSDASALLLDSSAVVRFVPNANFNGNATFSYRAWDQSSGVNGQSGVNVSANGGTTGFSSAVETAAITVTAVNDAPVLDSSGSPTLTAIPEDTAAPAGNTVAQIVIDGSVTDLDGSPVEAIALTGADNANGAWQYSTDGGTTFSAVGAVSDSAAILLDSAAVLRFVPNANYSGSATFTYRAWDQSGGSNGQTGVDASFNGGATAFSAASETAAITVTPNPNAPQATSASVLSFEGTSSYVDAGDPGTGPGSDQLDPKTGDLTVEAWFYYAGPVAGQQTIVGKGNHPHTEAGYSMFLDNGELVVRVNGTGSSAADDTAAASIAMPAGTGWHHVAMVIDQGPGVLGSSVTGYLNGSSAGWTPGFGSVMDDFFTAPVGGIDSDGDFLIGAVQNDGGNPIFFFDAEIADVRVWSQARTQGEIETGLGEDLAGDEAGLIANWRMNEGSGDTIFDNSALGLDGTAVDGPLWESGNSFTIVQDSVLDGRVSALDPNGDQLTYSVSAGASNGMATIDAGTGTWEYTPNGGFTGGDSFSYQVSDGSNADTVNIDVTVTP